MLVEGVLKGQTGQSHLPGPREYPLVDCLLVAGVLPEREDAPQAIRADPGEGLDELVVGRATS